jgi:hypothetical protein
MPSRISTLHLHFLIVNTVTASPTFPKELWTEIFNELYRMGESDAAAMARRLVNHHIGFDSPHLPWRVVDATHDMCWGGSITPEQKNTIEWKKLEAIICSPSQDGFDPGKLVRTLIISIGRQYSLAASCARCMPNITALRMVQLDEPYTLYQIYKPFSHLSSIIHLHLD